MLPTLYIQSEIKSLNFLKKTDNIIYTGPELSADPTHYMVVHFVQGDFHVYVAETNLKCTRRLLVCARTA